MTSISSVAVVGAGLAGLSCAQALRSAGLQVTVLDKSRGVAGRMSTRRGEGWQADHGAQYFTARHPAFAAEVARWTDAGVAAPWTPRIAVLGGDDPQRDLRGSLGGGASGGVGDAREGGDGGLVRHVGVPRMTSPAQWLAEGLGVRTGHTVQALKRDGARWRLGTAEHGWLPEAFDALVLAMPAPQADTLLRQGWQGMDGAAAVADADADARAHAQAQALADVAAAVTMRGCWALMLRFDAPVDLPFDAAFVNAGPLRWMARDSHKPGRPASASAAAYETWVLHASPEWSEAHIEDTPEAAAQALLAAFAGWGGPRPAAWTAHRWRYADSLPPPPVLRHWLPEWGLGLCGDWLAAGKVEGAWLSGHGLAMQVLGRQM